MLLYLIEAKTEPFHWRDVEAIPLYLVGIMIVAALFRVSQELPPASQSLMLKAMGIVALVAIRFYAIRKPVRQTAPEESYS